MATLYKTDGTQQEIKLDSNREQRFAQLQKLVGGYVQFIGLHLEGRKLAVNSDGRPMGLKRNAAATARLQSESKVPVVDLVGDVVLLEKGEFNL